MRRSLVRVSQQMHMFFKVILSLTRRKKCSKASWNNKEIKVSPHFVPRLVAKVWLVP